MVKFNAHAKAIIKALDAADQGFIKAHEATAKQMTQFIDACYVSGLQRTPAAAKLVGAAVREGFADFVAMGAIQKSTVANYATGASRAFFHGVEWSAGTHKDASLAVPNPNTGKTRTSGTVKTTDNKALVKTLSKALEQARIMQADSLAAGIVDLIIEIDPTFTESAE